MERKESYDSQSYTLRKNILNAQGTDKVKSEKVQNFLVLGGNGFIASKLIDIIVQNSYIGKILDRANPEDHIARSDVEYVYADFGSGLALPEALSDIDYVVHAISISIPSTSNEYPLDDIRGNLINTVQLLNIMNSLSIKRILFCPQAAQYMGTQRKFLSKKINQ